MIPLKQSALAISPWSYFLYALLLSALVRAVITLFRSFRLVHEDGGGFTGFWCYFFRLFIGISPKGFVAQMSEEQKERARGDYLSPLVLGTLELAAFPFLFAAELYTYVGAWIGLKLVAQYKHWLDDRGSFNSFLVGNALVLLLAFTCLQGYVHYKT